MYHSSSVNYFYISIFCIFTIDVFTLSGLILNLMGTCSLQCNHDYDVRQTLRLSRAFKVLIHLYLINRQKWNSKDLVITETSFQTSKSCVWFSKCNHWESTQAFY